MGQPRGRADRERGLNPVAARALIALAGLVIAVRAWLLGNSLVNAVVLLVAALASGAVAVIRLAQIERDLREDLGPRVTSEMAAAVGELFTPEWGLFVALAGAAGMAIAGLGLLLGRAAP